MSNEILQPNVPAAPVTDNQSTEAKKDAKIVKWFSFAGMVLQALASIFSKKN